MLSLPHLIVIFVLALVIFGPEKLPELARILGKATAEFRRMTSDFRFALEQEVRDLDRQVRIHEEERKAAESQIPPNWPLATPAGEASAAETKPVTDSVQSSPPPSDTTPNTIAPPHDKSSEDHAA